MRTSEANLSEVAQKDVSHRLAARQATIRINAFQITIYHIPEIRKSAPSCSGLVRASATKQCALALVKVRYWLRRLVRVGLDLVRAGISGRKASLLQHEGELWEVNLWLRMSAI